MVWLCVRFRFTPPKKFETTWMVSGLVQGNIVSKLVTLPDTHWIEVQPFCLMQLPKSGDRLDINVSRARQVSLDCCCETAIGVNII